MPKLLYESCFVCKCLKKLDWNWNRNSVHISIAESFLKFFVKGDCIRAVLAPKILPNPGCTKRQCSILRAVWSPHQPNGKKSRTERVLNIHTHTRIQYHKTSKMSFGFSREHESCCYGNKLLVFSTARHGCRISWLQYKSRHESAENTSQGTCIVNSEMLFSLRTT